MTIMDKEISIAEGNDYGLIAQHERDTGPCSVWHHMKAVSTTYKEIIQRGNSIIPVIITYLENEDSGISVIHLLEEIVPIKDHPYQPERLGDTGMAAWDVKEAREKWIQWYNSNKQQSNG